MEGLLKQARSRFSRKEELGSTREGRAPPQRTASFKGEKRPQKWFRRQASHQMSFNDSGDEAEYAAAVAATAYAITSLESDDVDQRDINEPPQISLPRIWSKIIDTAAAMTHPGEALKSSADEQRVENSEDFNTPNAERNEMIPEKTIHPVPPIKRTPTMPKKRLSFADELTEDPAMPYSERTPTIKKTPTFDDEQLENDARIRPPRRTPTFGDDGLEDAKTMKPPILPSPNPPPPVPPLTIQPAVPPKAAQMPMDQETDADAWERVEMAKIKQRYEKLNATILEWEDKKRKKAKRKLEMKESEVEKKRAKAMQKYQIEMEQIKQIADGARAQAKEKQRNDELKVKEKANRYRETGEPPLPPMCGCL